MLTPSTPRQSAWPSARVLFTTFKLYESRMALVETSTKAGWLSFKALWKPFKKRVHCDNTEFLWTWLSLILTVTGLDFLWTWLSLGTSVDRSLRSIVLINIHQAQCTPGRIHLGTSGRWTLRDEFTPRQKLFFANWNFQKRLTWKTLANKNCDLKIPQLQLSTVGHSHMCSVDISDKQI